MSVEDTLLLLMAGLLSILALAVGLFVAIEVFRILRDFIAHLTRAPRRSPMSSPPNQPPPGTTMPLDPSKVPSLQDREAVEETIPEQEDGSPENEGS